MRSDIFHPDFKAQPWWWEAWTPNNALSQDPPARTDIVIVGAGYGGLSTALELRRNGVGAVVLVLDGVQDPGNVGTILRTTFALGGSGVIALKGTAELYSPKVLRGSMGALFRLPAVSADHAEFGEWAAAQGVELWVADAQGAPVETAAGGPSRRRPIALALGSEGAGVSPTLAALAVRRVGIPLLPGAESLNVAVAAGILLHEVKRAG